MDDGQQVLIEWAWWERAEQAASTLLLPALETGERHGLTDWWFIRKRPYWRLRYTGGPTARAFLDTALGRLRAQGAVTRWTHSVYEPEAHAFGGHSSMELAHALFHTDSRRLLHFLLRDGSEPGKEPGRRELALLMCGAFLRGARLDWYERGDVWARVTALRAVPNPLPEHPDLVGQTRVLLTADLRRLATSESLGRFASWWEAFERTGAALAALAVQGRLSRGLRAVCAHHVIFAWNRWGLSHRDQHCLSIAAGKAFMSDTTRTTVDTEQAAAGLRAALVEQLCANGAITTPVVEEALRTVPRHRFVPEAPLERAYADQTVSVKHDETGASISCASQPRIVALMLEQAALAPGMRVLEVGAGTGYNAALLAHLVGPSGTVTTIDVDTDLVNAARAHLKDAAVTTVEVLLGDGALGHPHKAPYDRVIATVGCHAVPRAWIEQLAPAGRLVAPVRIAGDVSRSIVFQPAAEGWESVDSQLSTFMPLRGGIGDDPRRILDVTPDGTVRLQANQDQHITAEQVHGVLNEPAETVWTGVDFGGMQPRDGLWLWLALTLDNAVSRMTATPGALSEGLVVPGLGWGDMASVPTSGRGLAYLTARPIDTPQGRRYEVGVIGHAPAGQELAATMAEQVRTWAPRRDQQVTFTLLPAAGQTPEPGPGRFVLHRGHFHLLVSWRQHR